MDETVLAIDLGGTNLRMAAIDHTGKILYRTKRSTPRSKNADAIVNSFVESAKECMENCQSHQAVCIAAAVPATVDFKEGTITKAPNLPELDGFEMVSTLEKRLNIKAILENDANAAALGENWLGASKDFENSIMITLGTGVGGGIILDGKILRGIDGTAGEIGHICVEPNGESCGCKSHGCVEQYASASAVVKMARKLSRRFSKTHWTRAEKLDSEDVYEKALQGDEIAQEVFRRQGFYLGIALGGLLNSLNPEVIVIGGGAAAGWDLFIPHLKRELKIRAYRKAVERVKILPAELGDDAGILGVAKLGFDYI